MPVFTVLAFEGSVALLLLLLSEVRPAAGLGGSFGRWRLRLRASKVA